eukprot:m.323626 g.323626  ORF g.323626 m.323626 type:complete len:1018 (-) comp55529_c0_seq4:116-3169(-)
MATAEPAGTPDSAVDTASSTPAAVSSAPAATDSGVVAPSAGAEMDTSTSTTATAAMDTTSNEPPAPAPAPDPPSVSEQRETIRKYTSQRLTVGDRWNLVPAPWMKFWRMYVGERPRNSYYSSAPPPNPASFPGPIDMKTLQSKDASGAVRLQEFLMEGQHYELIPEAGWDLLVQWFTLAPNCEPISRKVIGPDVAPTVEITLFPIKAAVQSDLTKTIPLEVSKETSLRDLKSQICTKFEYPDDDTTQMWTVLYGRASERLQQLNKPIREAYMIRGELVMIEKKNADGTWPTDARSTSGLTASSTASSTSMGASRGTGAGSFSSSYGTGSSSFGSSSFGSTTYYGGSSSIARGPPGLGNLGNTCFMNSGLQCLLNSGPLADFFQSGRYKPDINKSNPLGCGGRLAECFAELIEKMKTSSSSVYPYEMKEAISKFYPQFSGYQQHDAQELINCMLDGMHEDLNRILKKPYVEDEPDDPKVAEVDRAAKQWSNHRARNDSVIVDLLVGQFKSTLTCPDCHKISRTFDPTMFLPLPIPDKETTKLSITLMWADPKKLPMTYDLVLPKRSASVLQVKEAIAARSEVPASRLYLVEVFHGNVHRVYTNTDGISDIRLDDDLRAFEQLPSATPEDDKFIVVTHRSTRHYGGLYPTTYYTADGLPRLVRLSKAALSVEHVLFCAFNAFRRALPQSILDVLDSEAAQAAAAIDLSALPDSVQRAFTLSLANQSGTSSLGSLTLELLKSLVDAAHMSFIAIDWASDALLLQSYRAHSDIRESERAAPTTQSAASSSSVVTLDDCFDIFSRPEVLGETNKWRCPHCKEEKQATKVMEIWRIPSLLIVQLKRFSYNSYYREKINTYIDFPLEGLDLTDRICAPNPTNQKFIYDLYAVSHHHGGYGGGHYTAHALHLGTKKWHQFDDSYTSSANPEDCKKASAYVLFYKLRSPAATTATEPPVAATEEPEEPAADTDPAVAGTEEPAAGTEQAAATDQAAQEQPATDTEQAPTGQAATATTEDSSSAMDT